MKSEMKTNKTLSVVIPAYNEEEGIAAVLQQIPKAELNTLGYEVEVIVVNNNCTDRTEEIARAHGATVIFESKPGYGNAYKAGFANATGDIIVTGDADSTYPMDYIPKLLKILETDNIDFLNTNRLKTLHGESMTLWHVFGNWVLTTISKFLYWGVPFGDSQSGMWVFKRSIWEKLDVQSGGMPFSQELKVEAYWKGFKCAETNIEYRPRLGEVKLRGMQDAWLNLTELFYKRLSITRRKHEHVQRFAFVLDAVMPHQQGGREKRLHEITKRLVSEGREINVYTMQWWDGPKSIEREGIRYHAICKLYPLYVNDRRSIKQAIIFGLATFKLMFEPFDVLDVDSMPFFPLFSARIVTWLRGKKLYATWHEVWGKDYWFEYLKGSLGWYGYIMESIALMLPNVIISNSEHTTRLLRETGSKKDIRTIPLGVDLEGVFSADLAQEKSDVIFVGRLLLHKNAEMLVRAIGIVKESVPGIKALIIGDGPERSQIQASIDELSLHKNITIIEHVEEHVDVYGLMKASKMLVLPSVREGFGLVAVEANAAGIPVITTNHENNAAKDLIHEGVNGFLTEATEEGIAAKIIEILKTVHTMEPRRGIEQYDWMHVVQNFEQVFN